MFFDSNAFRVSAVMFILFLIFMTLIQPTLFFDSQGQLKPFDFTYSSETTPLPFAIFMYVSLIIFYLLILFIETYTK